MLNQVRWLPHFVANNLIKRLVVDGVVHRIAVAGGSQIGIDAYTYKIGAANVALRGITTVVRIKFHVFEYNFCHLCVVGIQTSPPKTRDLPAYKMKTKQKYIYANILLKSSYDVLLVSSLT